ncbi:MAG: hypothetical protein DRJ43_00020 [Thermoprotei archaeon]|nr:MAG: hypothetical protein DRJ43_00020 [Thermoprotei archaeon]RLG88548.1 MAG: hypothetical protein DRO15_02585 [Thermoprotei archaeon]
MRKYLKKYLVKGERYSLALSILVPILYILFIFRNVLWKSDPILAKEVIPVLSYIAYYSKSTRFLYAWSSMQMGYVKMFKLYDLIAIICSIPVIDDVIEVTNTLFVLIYIIAGLGMYYYMYKHTRLTFISTLSSIVYLSFPYLIDETLRGHLSFISTYAIVPIIFSLIEDLPRTFSCRKALSLALMFYIVMLARVDCMIYVLIPSLLYLAFLTLLMSELPLRDKVINVLKNCTISVPSFLLLTTMYWIPWLKGPKPYAIEIVSKRAYEVKYFSIWSRSIMENITGSYLSAEEHPLPFVILFMTALNLLMSLCLILKGHASNREYSLAAVLITMLFLAQGTLGTTGSVYMLLIEVVPILKYIHAPLRWGLVIGFIYTALMGSFLGKFKHIILRKQILRENVLILIALLVLLTLLTMNSYPILYRGFSTFKIPSNYISVFEYLNMVDDEGRVLFVPTQNRWMCINGTWTRDICMHSYIFHDKPIASTWIPYVKNPILDEISEIQYVISSEELLKLLGILGVRYICICPHRHYHYGYKQHIIFRKVLQNLTVVYAHNNIVVYKNPYYVPILYLTHNVCIIMGNTETLRLLLSFPSVDIREWAFISLTSITNRDQLSKLIELINTLSENSKIITIDYDYWYKHSINPNLRKIIASVLSSNKKCEEYYNVANGIVLIMNASTLWRIALLKTNCYLNKTIGEIPSIKSMNKDNASLILRFKVPVSCNYKMYLRLRGTGQLLLFLNTSNNTIRVVEVNNDHFKWIYVGCLNLTERSNTVWMKFYGNIELSHILLDMNGLFSYLNCMTNDSSTNESVVKYQRISPVLFKVTVRTNKPGLLILAEGYHPMWYCHDRNVMLSAISINFQFNGFYLREGNHKLIIEFSGQQWAELSYKLSFTTFMLIALYLIVTPLVNQRKYMKMKYCKKI